MEIEFLTFEDKVILQNALYHYIRNNSYKVQTQIAESLLNKLKNTASYDVVIERKDD